MRNLDFPVPLAVSGVAEFVFLMFRKNVFAIFVSRFSVRLGGAVFDDFGAVGRSVMRSVGQAVGRSVGQALGRSVPPPPPSPLLPPAKKSVVW